MPDLSNALAVGLLWVDPCGPPVRALRLALSLRAAREGYAVAEVFQLRRSRDEAVYDRAEQLAVDLDAQAVFIMGAVDRGRVDELAERARLVVVEVPGPTSVDERSR